MARRWFLVLSLLVLGVSSVHAEDALSLSRVLALARDRAPAVVTARARVDEERAGLVAADRRGTRNPVVTADVGPRWAEDTSIETRAQLSIPLELGGRRDKRVAVVTAQVDHQRLDAEDAVRRSLGEAAAAYYAVLHADRLVALATERLQLAESAALTARQRLRAGDIAALEVDLARGEVARARSGIASARSDRLRVGMRLADLVGIADVHVVGDLADRAALEAEAPALPRADLRALAQQATVASAEAALARALRWPSLDLRLTFEHERDAQLGLAGVAFELPLFERGQGDEARARARAHRSQIELAVQTSLVTTQRRTAAAAHVAAVEAAEILATEAVPLSLQNQAAATASYAAGKLELGALLVIRREVLDTRREHLDRLLDAALAAVDLWIARGAPLPSPR